MDTEPYNAPTYFSPSYFYGATSVVTSTRVIAYNTPMYFPSPYFYGNTSVATPTGASPYDAPTYFPPSYFYGATSVVASTGASSYYAQTYFAPSYFYGSPPSTVVGGPTPTPPPPPPDPTPPPPYIVPSAGRDQSAYASMLSILESTGVFLEVILGDSLQRSRAGADSYPLAIVTPKGWEESDDYDPTLLVRKVLFTITILVKVEEDCAWFNVLDDLADTVQNVIDRSNLGGTSLGALTKILGGRYGQTSRYPEQSIELDGNFFTLINPISPN